MPKCERCGGADTRGDIGGGEDVCRPCYLDVSIGEGRNGLVELHEVLTDIDQGALRDRLDTVLCELEDIMNGRGADLRRRKEANDHGKLG